MERGYLNKLSESEKEKLIQEGVADYRDEQIQDKSIEENDIKLESIGDTEIKEMNNGELISTNALSEYFGNIKTLDIYNWYADAIQRRDRDPLEVERFENHFFENGSFDQTFAYGDEKQGFLLGVTKYGAFIPTHFAPATIRGGYELIKKLGDADFPAIMAITPDLTKTITKLDNWKFLDLPLSQQFREENMEEQFVYNDHPDVQKVLAAFYMEYMNDHYQI